MARRRWRGNRDKETAELNITAFMNLMVILVPFLLITAVFSRLAVLELNLPTSQGEQQEELDESFQLEITVRDDIIEVGDRNTGLLTSIEMADEGYDYAKLTDYLKRIKAKYPEKTDVTLLLEPEISYDIVVQMMDATRVYEAVQGTEVVRAELFPEIAIGDAPIEES